MTTSVNKYVKNSINFAIEGKKEKSLVVRENICALTSMAYQPQVGLKQEWSDIKWIF